MTNDIYTFFSSIYNAHILYDLLLENFFRDTDAFDVTLSDFLSYLPKAAFREFIVLFIEMNNNKEMQ